MRITMQRHAPSRGKFALQSMLVRSADRVAAALWLRRPDPAADHAEERAGTVATGSPARQRTQLG